MDGKYFVHPKTSSNHWSLTLKFKKTRRNSKSGQVHKRTSYIDTQAILPPFLTVLFLAFSMTYTDPPINPKYTHTHTHTHTCNVFSGNLKEHGHGPSPAINKAILAKQASLSDGSCFTLRKRVQHEACLMVD